MKVYLDNEALMEIDEVTLTLLGHDLIDPVEEIKRRLKWVIEHKCDQCYERMEKEWMPKLRADPTIESIPKSKRDLIKLITKHRDYKSRLEREAIQDPKSEAVQE